jgi:hypothetical protein
MAGGIIVGKIGGGGGELINKKMDWGWFFKKG